MSLARFTIEVCSPELVDAGDEDKWLLSDQRVLSDLPAVMEHLADVMSNLLPVGYSVEIAEVDGE